MSQLKTPAMSKLSVPKSAVVNSAQKSHHINVGIKRAPSPQYMLTMVKLPSLKNRWPTPPDAIVSF